MFRGKQLLFQASLVLLCILVRVHSLHVQTLRNNGGVGGGKGTAAATAFLHSSPKLDETQDVEDVDSNRLSNVIRNSYSPLMMLPVQQQNSIFHHRAHPNSANSHGPGSSFNQQMGEDPEALYQDFIADSSRISKSHQATSFGEMRTLGNSRHRIPHYGTISTANSGSQADSAQRTQRTSVAMGKQVPYKRQEQLLKPKSVHVSEEQRSALLTNELPTGKDDNLRVLKKRTETSDKSSKRSSSNSNIEDLQRNRRLNEGDDEEATSNANPPIQVSKKSSNPFMEDASMMIPHSIASQLMLRSQRGQRQYDVPQIGKCPFLRILLPLSFRLIVMGGARIRVSALGVVLRRDLWVRSTLSGTWAVLEYYRQ